MAIYVANVTNPAGFDQADNGGNYQNPSWTFQPTSAGVYALTIPAYTVRRNDVPCEAVYDYPQTTLTFVRQWTQGATYQDLDVVRWSPASPNDPRFYRCVNPTGAGTNPPTYLGDNANWAHVGPTAEFVVFGSLSDDPQVGPYTGFALLTGGSQTLDPFTGKVDAAILRVWANATANHLSSSRAQHTWRPGSGARRPLDYAAQIKGSVINRDNVPNDTARLCQELRTNGRQLDGLVLNARANLTNVCEPYFTCLCLLPMSGQQPDIVRDALDALSRTMFSTATGTQSPGQWIGMAASPNNDYQSFPVKLRSNQISFATSTSVSIERGDSHDATAGLYAALAVNYALSGPNGATSARRLWMANNHATVKQALLKNVARRRRRISQTLAFGQAVGTPWVTSGAGKNCGTVRTWDTGVSYAVNDLAWNPSLTLTTNLLYRCKTAHSSAASSEPGVGGSWTTYWDVSTDAASTPPAQFLTETYQAWREYRSLQFLDAVEAFVGYRAAFQLWTLRPWEEDPTYRRLEVVSLSERFFECLKENDGQAKETDPISGDLRKTYWRELAPNHFPGATLTEMGFSSAAQSAFLASANDLYAACPPHGLLEGIRTMWKWNAADENAAGDVDWNSVAYDSDPSSSVGARVNEEALWYPDALSYPFLVAYDVPLSDDPNLDRERKITAFDRMTAKVPQLWRSRNHDSFAPVVWAAAYARLGITSVANEAVDFAQRHFAGTPEGLLNHEQMWLDTAQKWASGQDWRLV